MKIRKCKICSKRLGNTTFTKCSFCRTNIKKEKALKNKEKKALSPSKLKKDCDTLVSKIIRSKDGKCLHCGSIKNLQCAHLISRTSLKYRWDEENLITLCYACHIMWVHRNPLEFHNWLVSFYPLKYEFWFNHRNELTIETPSYIDIRSKLQQRLKELQI